MPDKDKTKRIQRSMLDEKRFLVEVLEEAANGDENSAWLVGEQRRFGEERCYSSKTRMRLKHQRPYHSHTEVNESRKTSMPFFKVFEFFHRKA